MSAADAQKEANRTNARNVADTNEMNYRLFREARGEDRKRHTIIGTTRALRHDYVLKPLVSKAMVSGKGRTSYRG